ncbi:hypothetical protein, partial [Myroides odoratus]|uniref:hypothetical protein n=1 Tax=Myroides odoratus TaxID=256 RepID=UPI00333E36A2
HKEQTSQRTNLTKNKPHKKQPHNPTDHKKGMSFNKTHPFLFSILSSHLANCHLPLLDFILYIHLQSPFHQAIWQIAICPYWTSYYTFIFNLHFIKPFGKLPFAPTEFHS